MITTIYEDGFCFKIVWQACRTMQVTFLQFKAFRYNSRMHCVNLSFSRHMTQLQMHKIMLFRNGTFFIFVQNINQTLKLLFKTKFKKKSLHVAYKSIFSGAVFSRKTGNGSGNILQKNNRLATIYSIISQFLCIQIFFIEVGKSCGNPETHGTYLSHISLAQGNSFLKARGL